MPRMKAQRVVALGALLLGLAAIAGCGATPAPVVAGPDACAGGEAHLRLQLGPEFARLVMKKALPGEGCALVYMRVAEETPEELEEDDEAGFEPDHELAFAFARGGQVAVDSVSRSAVAPGPVVMALSVGDINGDGVADLVIEEKQGEFGMTGYRGLRVFDVSKGAPREVFAEKLSVTTPEGLTMVPSWSAKRMASGPAIVFDGGGEVAVFAWNAGAGRFVRDEAQSSRPKPVAPAAEGGMFGDGVVEGAGAASAAASAVGGGDADGRKRSAKEEAAAKKAAAREEAAAKKAAAQEEAAAKKAAAKEEAAAKKAAAKEEAAAKKAAAKKKKGAPVEAAPVEEPLDLEALGL